MAARRASERAGVRVRQPALFVARSGERGEGRKGRRLRVSRRACAAAWLGWCGAVPPHRERTAERRCRLGRERGEARSAGSGSKKGIDAEDCRSLALLSSESAEGEAGFAFRVSPPRGLARSFSSHLLQTTAAGGHPDRLRRRGSVGTLPVFCLPVCHHGLPG